MLRRRGPIGRGLNVKSGRRFLTYTQGRAQRYLASRPSRLDSRNFAVRGLQLAPGELKSVDTAISQVQDTTGAVTLLNGIARGDDINERSGRQVTLKSIQMKVFSTATSGTGIDQIQRIMVIYDRQTNAAALTIAQVLNSASPMSQRNLENRARFTILYDKTFPINADGESGSKRYFSWYRKLNHPVTFNSGDAGTVADITTGSLYFLTVGTVAPGATAGSTNGTFRVRYEDK